MCDPIDKSDSEIGDADAHVEKLAPSNEQVNVPPASDSFHEIEALVDSLDNRLTDKLGATGAIVSTVNK